LLEVNAGAHYSSILKQRICALDVLYSSEYVFQEVESNTESEKPQRVKLKKGSWEEGLVGVAKGCKRMIILQPDLVVRVRYQLK
jgi:hypothetical protein